MNDHPGGSQTRPIIPMQPPTDIPLVESPPSLDHKVPERFLPSKTTLFIDRFMTYFIQVGGVLVIAAVLGIFVFILWQILPLFESAHVKPALSVPVPPGDYRELGIDEWGELPFVVDSTGLIYLIDPTGKQQTQQAATAFAEPKTLTAFSYNEQRQDIIYGTSDGFFSVVKLKYGTSFENGSRVITMETEASPFYRIGKEAAPVRMIDYGDSGAEKLAAAIQESEGKLEFHVGTLTQTTGLFGSGEIIPGQTFDLTTKISGKPLLLLVNSQGSDLVVSNEEGTVFYFARSGDTIRLVQQFKPFADLNPPGIGSMNFLLGGVSLVFTSQTGENRIFSLFRTEGSEIRTFGKTKEFDPLGSAATFFSVSLRNKSFLIGSESVASIRHGTTENIRWQEKLPFKVRLARLGGKYDRIAFLDTKNNLHLYSLRDLHPETSWKALFGKVWYEGASQPNYEWQSTGSTDDFEPKLSLIPLIIGTLKGTLYAMLFAIPIALLAAVYTSQFLHPDFRVIVKPTMEIMASLPSVVLGFLAALWLAPVLETRVPSVLLIVIMVPAFAFVFGFLWNQQPIRVRRLIKPGYEWLVFIPLFFVVAYTAWVLGPQLEKMSFVVTDPETGKKLADFRLWWRQVTELPFEQRNSLVVGFMMGFAVIPIIFTITEDALSNVPQDLRSASLALGASRWQTAIRVIVPTASAGIFSAIMIGLGRAVGETMIVVMATGNTPILDFNIFSGMRTLSANIAVELPEAPAGATLYRTLFLGGMALFLMTFVVNTFAEILRQHLRQKYKTV